jgi:glycopeptide antibiotics resistance protein
VRAEWARWGQVIVTCVALLPVAAVIAALRARRVGWRDAVAEVVAIGGTLPWLWMVLTPLPQKSRLHLVPLHELGWYLSGGLGEGLVQLVGNLAVFAAFGAAAPVRWRLPLWAVALAACAGSVAVETWQYVADIGRVASVDDVILNTVGGVLGALLTSRWWRVNR